MPNASQGARLYPRGFIGGIPAERVVRMNKPPADAPSLMHLFQIKNYHNADTTTYSNHEVEALYATYLKQVGEVTSFAFRKKVLSVALRAFGTKDFQEWIIQQRSSPASGELHRRFIRDIVRFLSGKRRELSLQVWAGLLNIDEDGGNTTPDPEVEEFFAIYPHAHDLRHTLQFWCSQNGGIEDLLQTLHLLFGDF